MSANESSKPCVATTSGGEENVGTMTSQPTTTTSQIIDTNEMHSNKDSGSDGAKRADWPQSTNDTLSPNPVAAGQGQNTNSAKRVIRKVMVIDPKKLQQAGLDRKLAEAIGRQKLKALAKEQKKSIQHGEPSKLSANEPSGSQLTGLMEISQAATITKTTEGTISTIKTKPSELTAATTDITTNTESTTSMVKTTSTPPTTTTLYTTKKLESVKNVFVKSSAVEVASDKLGTAASNSPAPDRKAFITPKITITGPVEDPSVVRIIPEHRLQNVKYLLQCKILKKQQLAAQAHQPVQAYQTVQAHKAVLTHQATPQTFQTTGTTTPLPSPMKIQTPLIAPKEEAEEFISISKPELLKKPSPAKTPQDIARVLDFNSEATTDASAIEASSSKMEKGVASDALHIKNYNPYAPKASLVKAETVGTRAVDVARLVARIGSVTMRKHVDQFSDKAENSTNSAVEIPKATIRCKNVPFEIKNNKVSVRKDQSSAKNASARKQPQEIMQKTPTSPLFALKDAGISAANKTVKLVYKLPSKQPVDNENDKPVIAPPNFGQHKDHLQFKDVPAFCTLKQPFSVATHSKDSSLPTNKTVKIVYKSPLKQPMDNETHNTVSVDLNAVQHNEPSQFKDFPILTSLKQPFSVATHSQEMPLPSNRTVKIMYKASPKQPIDNENDKTYSAYTNPSQPNEHLQFKDFPAFSPLKHPFPVVTHSQDLPLPTISTFRNPFPTSLIKVGQMEQSQNDNITTTPNNLEKVDYIPTTTENSPKSLIVLENKVLSQDEKIDLTALGLGTPKIEPTPEAQAMQTEETPALGDNPVVPSSTTPLKNMIPEGAKINNRTILSMDKLKLSAGKINELVKIIKANKVNSKHFLVVRKVENTQKPNEKLHELSKTKINITSNPNTKPMTETVAQPVTNSISPDFSSLYTSTSVPQNTLETPKSQSPSIPEASVSQLISNNTQPTCLIQTQNNLINPTSTVSTSLGLKCEPLTDQDSQSDSETQFKNPLPPIAQKMPGTEQYGRNKSSVYVIDSGEESDASISAVDFIASLAAENPITEDMKLELSPEELNLNASFAMNFSPLRIPNRDRTESIKSEITEQEFFEDCNAPNTELLPDTFEPEMVPDDVQIGKIITISEENILKAVAASKISDNETPTEMQEVFKLTKNTDFLGTRDTVKEEAQINNSENMNNLDIIVTDSLSETAVGPIIVKNIEIGHINNFEEPRPSPVIVKDLRVGVTACFGELSESEGVAVGGANLEGDKVLPVEGGTATNSLLNVEEHQKNDVSKSDASRLLEETSSAVEIETVQTPSAELEIKTSENTDFKVYLASSADPDTSVSLQSLEKSICEEAPKSDPPCAPTTCVQECNEMINTQNTSKLTQSPNQNLFESQMVQMDNQKPSKQSNVDETTECVEKKSVIGETSSVGPKRLPRFKKGKINLVQRKKMSGNAQQTKDTRLSENIKAAADENKADQETVIEGIAASSKICSEINKAFEKKIEKDLPSNEGESNVVSSPIKESIVEVENNNNSSVSGSSVEVERISTTPICNEAFSRPSGLKRKTADITELLHPPKMPKRKSANADIKSDTSSTDEKINNILVTAPKTEQTELTIAKNPFKKPKIDLNVDQKPIKGIQNLLTKFHKEKNIIEDKVVKEQAIGEYELTIDNVRREDTLAQAVDVGKSIGEHLRAVKVEGSAENLAKYAEEIIQTIENTAEQPKSPENAEDETDRLGNSLKQEGQVGTELAEKNMLHFAKSNFKASDADKPDTAEIAKASKDCDIVNVTDKEELEKNMSEDNKESEKIKSDFLGFDHSFPGTHNIESNLQQILTITNSAEKTKTQEENFSTAERESPHADTSDGPQKSWLNTTKTTLSKSKMGQVRKSTNRRSVPLKKRWGVLRKSEDDIDIVDDTSPADDDDEDDEMNYAGAQQNTTQPKDSSSDANKKAMNVNDIGEGETGKSTFLESTAKEEATDNTKNENEKSKVMEVAAAFTPSGPTIDLTAIKRKRYSRDITIVQNPPQESVPTSENKSSSVLETPNKKLRLMSTEIDRKESENSTVTKATQPKELLQQQPQNILETSSTTDSPNTANEPVTNSIAGRSSSHVSEGLIENIEEAPKKPKVKRGRKPKAKIECNESIDIKLISADTASTQTANKSGNTSATDRPSENFKAEGNIAKEAETATEQPKTPKKRGRKPKAKTVDTSESTSSKGCKEVAANVKKKSTRGKSKGNELRPSLSGVLVKEEFVRTDSELVVPSLIEMEIIEAAIGKSPDAMQAQSDKQKIATSTPTAVQLPEEGAKKSRRNRKSLGEIVVSLAKTQTENETINKEESTPVVPKKRGRKPKSLTTALLNATDSEVCNGVAEPKKSIVSLAKTQTENETINKEESTPVVPKKRGRKPKSLTMALLNATDSEVCNGVAEPKKSIESTSNKLGEDLNAPNMDEKVNDSSVNVSQAAAELETPVKIPKKRGRKPKALLATPETPADEESAKTPGKQQGRKVKVVDLETRGTFNERLLLVTKRAQLDTDEVLTVEPVATSSNTSAISCGLCLQQMERDAWLDHLASHYGVGWIVGEMTATNVTIRSEVLKAMTAFLKTTAGEYPLTCRMCKRTFRSALGTLQHIELCGAANTRAPCDYCNRDYSKLSLATHMRDCSQKMLNKTDDSPEAGDATTEINETVLNNVGRMKRASVQKAEKILKAIGRDSKSAGILSLKDAKNYIELVPVAVLEKISEKWSYDLESVGKAHCPAQNCAFESQELNTLQAHFASCELKESSKPKGVYKCQLCVGSTKTYQSAKLATKHVFQKHKNTDDASDFEADVSDCGIKTDDESSGADDDVSSGVDSNEESVRGDGGESSNEGGEVRKTVPKKKSKKKKPVTPVTPVTNDPNSEKLYPPRDPAYYRKVPQLWEEFTSQNYSTQPLYTDTKVNYTICARAHYEKYLPRFKCSMKFNVNSDLKLTSMKPKTQFGKAESLEWSQLQLLEMSTQNGEHLLFIGEAIKIVGWVPLPADISEQYLLISTRREYTRYYEPKIGNTLLWLYKVIPAKGSEPFCMQLHYAINIPNGPVLCLAFLPSGGYDASANRLGLVAIGTPTSTIRVYALPLIVEKQAATTAPSVSEKSAHILQNLTVIDLQPVWLLALDITKNDLSAHPFVNTQCTALCWSEFSEHMHIFAGYANGCISYWDISSDMNLNRTVIDGVPHFVPMNFFYTREKKVGAMALHYDPSGVRVLAVAVSWRLLLFYDLQLFVRPMLLKEEMTRNEVTDLEWSPIWQTLAVAVSDSLPNNGRCTYAVSPTNIGFKNESIDKMLGAVTKIHYNPLQPLLANATENGDVVILDIREMHLKEIMRDSQRNCRAVAIMDVKCLNGKDIPRLDQKAMPPGWKFFDDTYREKYGVVFGPVTKVDKIHKPQYLSDQRRPPLHLIPCTRINGLRCNLNTHGGNLLALGYENGFVRIFKAERKSFQ
ncbi:uncharacterized protein LOC129240091 [Anastrepha obliqua]|uniref:uncharacterized protein LOC129240091 n=1 Tax=Anastrepha obliqua TaxID=95512 RepID=UPI00240A8BE3|nr:uncharacterized protein LOC129240091 [Anastrepha obliqua]XP_054731568.1 uncharacterized protein LOC129240091 [Anastrepha obliqua]